MKNEMYGTVTLHVSRCTKSDNNNLAELESYYKLNDFNIDRLIGDRIGSLGLKIHNAEINWERFFGKDE